MASRDDAGQVTAFVVVFMVALIGFAGLVIDGSVALSAKRRAMNEAQGAARAGAQALDERAYREEGISVIKRDAAIDRVDSYMAAAHIPQSNYRVEFAGSDTVVVDEWFTKRLNILGAFGFPSITARGHGAARTAHGIVQEGG
jgi:Flp pilus assembly protein TadG